MVFNISSHTGLKNKGNQSKIKTRFKNPKDNKKE